MNGNAMKEGSKNGSGWLRLLISFELVLIFCLCASARASDAPYFTECDVYSFNGPNGTFIALDVALTDPNGTLPTSIQSLSVSGPEGFSYSLGPGDLYSSSGYFATIAGTPVQGEYTFTVTDTEGYSATSHRYYTAETVIPLPDTAKFQAANLRPKDPLDPAIVLSWAQIDTYSGDLFYRARVYDADSNTVWTSGFTTGTSVQLPDQYSQNIIGGTNYQWRVEAFDSDSYATSNHRAVSEKIELSVITLNNQSPFFNYATIYNRHTSSGFFTTLDVQVVDPDGAVPLSIESITVTGPNDFNQTLQSTDYDFVWSAYFRIIADRPTSGIYTFTVTDTTGRTATTYDYVESHDVPLVDSSTMQASGDPLAPTLSWAAPDNMDRSLYYVAQIFDPDDNEVWRVWMVPNTFATVSSGILQSGVDYTWRVRAQDSKYGVHYNRSQTDSVNLASSLLNNLRPYFTYPAVYNRHDPDGFFTTMDIYLADPNGTLPDSITSLTVTGPGSPPSFSYTFQTEDFDAQYGSYFHRVSGIPADGVYTITVTDQEDLTAVTHEYVQVGETIPALDESSINVTGDPLAPTISWSAISGYPGILYYRVVLQDSNGVWVYNSARQPYTSLTIPAGYIQSGETYQFRIEAYDDRDWIIYNNRSNSRWHDATLTPLELRYAVKGDGTVIDKKTGLMWQQADDGTRETGQQQVSTVRICN